MRVTVNPPSRLRRATSFSKEATIADSLQLWAPFERSCRGATEDCRVVDKVKKLLIL